METSTSLTQSMQHITTTKLDALSRQQQSYETSKQRILGAAACQSTQAGKVKVLLDALEVHDIDAPANISKANVRRFLEQSRHDPSVPSALLREWQMTLEQALEAPSRKYEHASLFGRLVVEWLGSEALPLSDASSDSQDHFEHVGRKEMYDQRREWESIVFAEGSTSNPAAIKTYLTGIFGSTSKAKKMVKEPLEALREGMRSFKLGTFDTLVLQTCMTGMLKTDLLSEEKRKALVDFSNNSTLLQEIADVLNMQIDALENWSWGEEGVPVSVRRALNGKYRVYMDEEILQALLIHFIGMKWATHFRTVFGAFFHSGAWKQSSDNSLDGPARRKRQRFFGQGSGQSVRNERRERYQSDYFLSQLPELFDDGTDNYSEGSPNDDVKSPMAIKQSLLHLISTELLLNARLNRSITVFQSDFKWFGPSLPHATIISVLHFFGVPETWLKFFEKFLKAPVKFVQDGPEAQTQTRRCGVPIQHRLSDAMGEAVLFCLDFAVNKSTESNLYRLHDDIWFWGSSNASALAWESIQEFASVMGLTLNEGKTGAAKVSGDLDVVPHETSLSNRLPQGEVRWGFLRLDSSGKWTIDDQQVETHIRELQQQLKACKSILAWVQAWNMYVARFISNNFGEPANCLGRPHLDMVIEAFEKIQRGLFADIDLPGENVGEYLRVELAARFGVENIPDGFFYFPIELGGLGMRNPLIPLFLVRGESLSDPMVKFDEAFELEEADYYNAKQSYEDGTSISRHLRTNTHDNEPFMSLDEYSRCREETSIHLHGAYTALLEPPRSAIVEPTPDVRNADRKLDPVAYHRGRDVYEQWVLQLYGADIIRRYGGLALGEKKLLPIGLASILRSEKIRWQG
ncbi:hypothetical protein IMSHALPRED_004779 [Imshaugia aleurites]|uniref:Reverse transcriptase n=1 Tax=Imshaugia aleurites TaxID=172621 RepID=A0A8H3F5Y2_9LECA|nr:hypothetical protein IMSHALPRED_004779 [Imshaugia aleurites]